MSMLKYVLALLALVVVSLAPVSADEGYIPFFPDFLEPDGIGFRGTAELRYHACWTSNSSDACYDNPAGTNYSYGEDTALLTPITLEYRANYFYNKLFYTQLFFDFGSAITSNEIKSGHEGEDSALITSDINTNAFLQEFLTAEEKSLLQSLDSNRIFDLKTESSFLLFSAGLGLDLWIIEIVTGPYLMFHDTKVSLRSCKNVNLGSWSGFPAYIPKKCEFNTDDIIKLDEQKFSGFVVGGFSHISLVFLQTDNWRISYEVGSFRSTGFMSTSRDSNFKPVDYRGLSFSSGLIITSDPDCTGTTMEVNGAQQPVDCKTRKGEDMSDDADITQGLKITYYFN